MEEEVKNWNDRVTAGDPTTLMAWYLKEINERLDENTEETDGR